jgi:type IV secretion system protein VirD4
MRPVRHPTTTKGAAAATGAHGVGIYLGEGRLGPVFAGPQQCALVLGPPRSGKTSSVVVPNLLYANHAVACVSTKPDVLEATLAYRDRLGRCVLFDPSGLTKVPDGVEVVGWSPLRAARSWQDAVLVADAMVGAARPPGPSAEAAHWAERAAALLAPLLHSAALDGSPLRRVVAEVNRREADRALGVLARAGADHALDVLTGIIATDAREQSGIWSSAASMLSAYRLPAALDAAERPLFDPEDLVCSSSTLYVVAPSEHQHLCAPLVAGLLREIRTAAYQASTTRPCSVLFVLDELANIAPLHDLPTLVAEGASQGVVTLACLQDLSQARQRWGTMADGFLSLFGAKLFLGGIGDPRTLEAVSRLAGHEDRPVMSRPYGLASALSWQKVPSRSVRRLPRLPVDEVACPRPRTATLLLGAQASRVALAPFFLHLPWHERFPWAVRDVL